MMNFPRIPTLIIGCLAAGLSFWIASNLVSQPAAAMLAGGLIAASIAYGRPRPPQDKNQHHGEGTKAYGADHMLLEMHRHRMSLKLSNMEIDRELQRSVFQVASELVGCRDESDALERFQTAIKSYWKHSSIDLLIWEKGKWRSFGRHTTQKINKPPSLNQPIQLPDGNNHQLLIDLSPAVDGQAALIVNDAKHQPILNHHPDFNEVYLAEILRGQLALSLRRVVLYQELQELGRIDPLTKTWRRWYGQERLEELVNSGVIVAVAMVDIDHFKGINDTFGHAAGDTVLQAVGQTINRTIRKGDIAFRYGGEEFCVVLPETSSTGSYQVGERIRQAIASLADLPRSVTVSIGVSSCRRDEEADTFVARADDALYQAKNSGRDRVINADADTAADVLRTMKKFIRKDNTTGSMSRDDWDQVDDGDMPHTSRSYIKE